MVIYLFCYVVYGVPYNELRYILVYAAFFRLSYERVAGIVGRVLHFKAFHNLFKAPAPLIVRKLFTSLAAFIRAQVVKKLSMV